MKEEKETKKTEEKNSELETQLKETQKKVDEYTNDLKRLQAEFENHIKRTDKEKQNLCEFASASLIKKLLPILDDFESAIKHLKEKETDKETLSGVEMIFNNIKKVMNEEGLSEIRSEGIADPFKHEILLQKESDKEEGTILQVLQKGYELKGKVLRPSKVMVSKNS